MPKFRIRVSFRDDITAEFRLEFQSRDFGNSIQRCPNVSVCRIISYILYYILYIYNMYIIYSIHIYRTRFFLYFLQRHFYLSIISSRQTRVILNDSKMDEEVRELAARQPRQSFDSLFFASFDIVRRISFRSDRKAIRLFKRRSTTNHRKVEKERREVGWWRGDSPRDEKSRGGRKIGIGEKKCVDGRRKFSGCRKSFESRYPVGSKSRSTNEFCPCNLYRYKAQSLFSVAAFVSLRIVSFR